MNNNNLTDYQLRSDVAPIDFGQYRKYRMQDLYTESISRPPYDFNENLEFPINSVHDMMISFISDSTDETWQIGEDKRFFLIEKLSQSPVDIGIDKYSIQDFKIIAFGNQELDNSRFVTYSKIGYSYGFITETAYVKDTISKSGFFLTISMYVNKNNTINDGRYQYGTVATPFMGTLTHIIANQLIDK